MIQVAPVSHGSYILSVVVLARLNTTSYYHNDINFKWNIHNFYFSIIFFNFLTKKLFDLEDCCRRETNVQILIICPQPWHCLMKTICPLVLSIRRLFFSYLKSRATRVYLIINGRGRLFNSFKLIISERWVKELMCSFTVYCAVHCMSPSQVNHVYPQVKQALK